jgi:hypothetical protein
MEYALPKFGGVLLPLPNKLRVKNRIRYFVSVMRVVQHGKRADSIVKNMLLHSPGMVAPQRRSILKRSLVSSESGPGEQQLAPTCSASRRRE